MLKDVFHHSRQEDTNKGAELMCLHSVVQVLGVQGEAQG